MPPTAASASANLTGRRKSVMVSGAVGRERRSAAISDEPEAAEPHEHLDPGRGLGRRRAADLHLERLEAAIFVVGEEHEVRRVAAVVALRDAGTQVVVGRAPSYG